MIFFLFLFVLIEFFRLQNFTIFQKIPVIVAANKTDLIVASETSSTGTSSSARTVSLMRRYPFVRRCVKCSAVENISVLSDIFEEAQRMVLYPLMPLYNLEMGTLSIELELALTRIFRIYDADYDHLLSDNDIDIFQVKTFPYAVFDKDLTNLKKVISSIYNTAVETYQRMIESINATSNKQQQPTIPPPEPVLKDGKFTLHGFYAIFDGFISQERFDVVWHALRHYGYDDDLNLYIPSSILYIHNDEQMQSSKTALLSNNNWRLSSSCKTFLTKLFHQFDSNHDGILSNDDIRMMFSLLSPPQHATLPPWHPKRSQQLFDNKSCFSRLKQQTPSSMSPPSIDETSGGGNAVTGHVDDGSNESPTESVDGNKTNLSDSTLIIPEASSSHPVTQTVISHSGLSILSASDSLPSIDVGNYMYPPYSTMGVSMTYLEWMNRWYTMALISPSITRTELYRLGHWEDYNVTSRKRSNIKSKRKNHRHNRVTTRQPDRHFPMIPTGITTTKVAFTTTTTATNKNVSSSSYKSREIRILVLGSQSCGKTSLLNLLCAGETAPASVATAAAAVESSSQSSSPVPFVRAATDTTPTQHPETSGSYISMKRKSMFSSAVLGKSSSRYSEMEGKEFIVHLIFTEIPESFTTGNQATLLSEYLGSSNINTKTKSNTKDRVSNVYDMVMLVFDCTNHKSFTFVKDLESTLIMNETTPRIFIGTKADQVFNTKTTLSSELEDKNVVVNVDPTQIHQIDHNTTIDAATIHCQESDLEHPLLISSFDATKHRDMNTNSNTNNVDPNNTATTTTSSNSCGSSISSSSSSWNNDCIYIGTNDRLRILDHISRCSITNEPNIEKNKSRPHEEQRKRKEADEQRRRTMMWLGGIAVTVGVAVAVSVSLLWRSSSSGSSSSSNKTNNHTNNNRNNNTTTISSNSTKDTVSGGFNWLRSWFLGK